MNNNPCLQHGTVKILFLLQRSEAGFNLCVTWTQVVCTCWRERGWISLLLGIQYEHIYAQVCFSKHLKLFSHTAERASDGTQNLIPQGHRRHTLFIFLLSLGYSKLSQTLSPPTTTTFLLPSTRTNFRNLLNLLPIDFPPEFTLLLKIQRIKKGDTPHHQCGYIHILPHELWNMPAKAHTNCTYTHTCPHAHSGKSLETSFNSVWLLGDLTGPRSKGEFKKWLLWRRERWC